MYEWGERPGGYLRISGMIWICAFGACSNALQSNLDSSNTDVSFTMANSNSFLSAYEILPIAQENK